MFVPENEVERLAPLQSYDLMDSGEEKDFDAIAALCVWISSRQVKPFSSTSSLVKNFRLKPLGDSEADKRN